MAKIVNLRQARKAKARSEARAEADGKAARHGRTKGEKAAEEADRARAARDLEGKRIDDE